MSQFAFVFDMDGVIVDSNTLHAKAWYVYLSQYGVPADSMLKRMHGKRNDQIVRELFGSELTEQQVFAHGAAKEELYRTMMRPQLKEHLVPGLLDFLHENRLRPMAVASNAEPANVDFVLDEADLRQYFQVVVNGHQVEYPKPHPEIYLRTAELLGVSPAQCVVFEDSPSGIHAAKAAGTRIVSVRTTEAKLPETDWSVTDFREPQLASWIEEAER